jgi:predicted hotdog family 3-hydroxylacyl-ACP dehydratase
MMDAIQFIPHEKPMVFIDHIIDVSEEMAIAELCITPDLMFCEEKGLPTWTSIEIMAQTVSAFSGANSQKKVANAKPKIGFLLGTRKMHLPIPYFEMGDTVSIKVEQGYIHEGLGQFHCEISYKEHKITAVLSVFEPPETNDKNGELT